MDVFGLFLVLLSRVPSLLFEVGGRQRIRRPLSYAQSGTDAVGQGGHGTFARATHVYHVLANALGFGHLELIGQLAYVLHAYLTLILGGNEHQYQNQPDKNLHLIAIEEVAGHQ